MIIVECDQGGQEWHAARAGVITASMFRVARERLKVGPSKGDFSSAAKDYAFRLAIERISGSPLDEGFETWQMRRGHDLEPAARMAHEARTGLFVNKAGFILTDDGKFGASADGLIGSDGGSEYKCLVSPEEMRKVLIDHDFSKFHDQVQGCLWLSGRKWWHFCLYCPALEPIGKELWMREVVRDEDYIFELELDLLKFENLVADTEAALRMREAA
jgi:hypothetical protein